MLKGYRVFHDFPADKFNIDHIVVGPNGVFAVETKARAKPDTGDGKKDARCDYDGQQLRFPHKTESEPVEQAKRQAKWLSKWLSSAVGDSVSVKPILAIPGWYVHSVAKSTDVQPFFGTNPEALFLQVKSSILDASMMKRIVHQLEARCRDVELRAYDELKPEK